MWGKGGWVHADMRLILGLIYEYICWLHMGFCSSFVFVVIMSMVCCFVTDLWCILVVSYLLYLVL